MKISIITASYNYANYIEDVINSVINQTYYDWELIIVDDCSSDNSVEIIKSFCEKDNRIKLFQNEINKGLKETILTGLTHVTGDWVAFLESDDLFKPDNLLKKVEIAQKHPDVKLIFNKLEFLWDKNRPDYNKKQFEQTQKELSKMTFPRNMFYDFYMKNMILTFSCVMVEKNALKKADFNSPVDAFLDWWLWIHLAYENKFYYLDEALAEWNLHHKSYISYSKKIVLMPLQAKAYFDVFKKTKQSEIILFMCRSSFPLAVFRVKRFISKLVNKS
jgi:glycosyltransferase involved in cell wall biosynthesis